MPSMKHLPWSQEEARQQKWLTTKEAEEMLDGERGKLVITEKMDGANACITSDKVYARSHSGEPHRDEWDYLKKRHREELMHQIGDNVAVFGEYLYARHSIKYEDLPSYFLVFGVYYNGVWCDWSTVKTVADKLGLETVPVIDTVVRDDKNTQEIIESVAREPEGESHYGRVREGYTVRDQEGFHIDKLTDNMAKCVRENHVQTDELHWRKGNEVETNDLE